MLKKFLIGAALVAGAAAMASCGSKKAQSADASSPNDSILMVYYSQTGNTKLLAEAIKEHLGELATVEIVPVKPYDGDYDETVNRWKAELDSNVTVEIQPLDIDFDKYNTIFLGFPIWGGTYATPVKTFLEQNDLSGKKIVTFATFGSGGLDIATADVANAQPGAEVYRGYGVRAARIDNAFYELDRYLIENNYKEGILETLADYSEPTILNEEAIEIFNAACSGYKFPLGTPVSVSERTTSKGRDLRYEVESERPDGTKSTSTIYVTHKNEEGAVPEFTEVVRH